MKALRRFILVLPAVLLAVLLPAGAAWAGGGGEGVLSPWAAGRAIRQAMLRAEAALQSGETATAAAEIAKATNVYREVFAAPFGETEPDLAADLARELDAATAAVTAAPTAAATAGDQVQLSFSRGLVWGMLLEGAFRRGMTHLDAGEYQQAEIWLQLREHPERTSQSPLESPIEETLAELRSGESGRKEDGIEIVRQELSRVYLARLRRSLEETEKAWKRGFLTQQAFWAGSSLGYYRILSPDIKRAMDEGTVRDLDAAFAELAAQVREGRYPASTLAGIQEKLRLYSPVRWDETKVEEKIGLLFTFLDLAVTEYRDAGVSGGQVRIPLEYQEAVSFIREAKGIIAELYPYLHQKDPAAAAALLERIAGIEDLAQGKGPLDRLAREVERLRETVTDVSGVAVKTARGGVELLSVVAGNLARLPDLAASGKYREAERLRMESYALFESGPEATLRNRAPRLAGKLEGLFWEGWGGEPGLSRLLGSGAGKDEVAGTVAVMNAALTEARGVLAGPQTALAVILQSMSIIVREGLEAALILAAVLGYLATIGQTRLRRHLYLGVLLALLATMGTWWLSVAVIEISGAGRELIEGITGLLAVAVLFVVINWLFRKAYVDDWLAGIRTRAEAAIRMESPLIMVGLGFMVVYREGFETVLFYQALLNGGNLAPVAAGFAGGLAMVLAVSYPLLVLGRRLPLKPFFKVTGVLLLLLAFKLMGGGLRELQEAGVLGSTPLLSIPAFFWLQEILGVFPTLETSLGQILLLLALLLSWVLARRRNRRSMGRQM